MAMAQKPGKLVLKALAALVPLMVLIGVSTSGNGMNGATSKAVDGAGRRLQTATYDFATQLEMTICLTEEHTSDSATSTTGQVRDKTRHYVVHGTPSLVLPRPANMRALRTLGLRYFLKGKYAEIPSSLP